MSKLILHYEDHFSYEMLLRCFDEYMESPNFKRQGLESITVYSNQIKKYTAYFKRNKSGSITGKCWHETAKPKTKDKER